MRSIFQRLVFWAHLIMGLLAGLIILSMAVSGLLISYEQPLLEWANRSLRVTPESGALPLSVEALLAKVREAMPEANPTGLTWKADPAAPVTLSVERQGVFFLNPYTGVLLGRGNQAWQDFFHWMTDWHRFLGQHDANRPIGKAITGAGTLLFGGLLVSGIYLWWPRHWRWSNLRAAMLLNPRLKGRARDWNWHNVIGFWSAFPLLLIILTGLIMSYGWANNLLFTLAGSPPPPPRASPAAGGGPRESARPAPPSLGGLSALLAEVRLQIPEWQLLSLRMPMKPGEPFPLMVDRGGRGQVHLRTMLNLDLAQGKVLPSPDDFQQQNLGRRLRMFARFLHTGELFGLIGQTVAALCTLAAILLVWTGLALACRRFFGRKSSAQSNMARIDV
jgi:uncharacterized iron-regulated membrane protein